MPEYATVLLLVTLALAFVDRSAFYTALIVAANFVLNEGFCRATGEYTPWLWFTLTDALAAWVLTQRLPRFGQVGAAVAAIYATQIMLHVTFWLSATMEPYRYWQSLTGLATMQLILLVIGGAYGGGRMVRRHFALRRVSALSYPPRN